MTEATTPAAPPLPSVDDAPPSDQGGSVARKGFNYQDEIAVGYLLEMLDDPTIVQVHCETHNDLLVVRVSADVRTAEYVQVKGAELPKLWSMADLCRRENGKIGTSIYEGSLACDKHAEESLFRIVTLRDVDKDLRVLKLPRNIDARKLDCEAMKALKAATDVRCVGALSKKNNGSTFWLPRCVWDVRHGEEQIATANFKTAMKLASVEGSPLLPEQADALLDELRSRAKSAGAAIWSSHKAMKIISRKELLEWWRKRLEELFLGAAAPAGGKLVEKLDEIHALPEQIKMAVDLRRAYAQAVRTPRYMVDPETQYLQGKVKTQLAIARAKFSAGEIEMNGKQFLLHCMEQVAAVNAASSPSGEDRSEFVQGCMYDITDRCLHRFSPPS